MRLRLVFDQVGGYDQWSVRTILKLSVGPQSVTNYREFMVMLALMIGVSLIVGYNIIA